MHPFFLPLPTKYKAEVLRGVVDAVSSICLNKKELFIHLHLT